MMEDKISVIERMGIALSDRTNLVLVYAGEKPATVICMSGSAYNPETETRELRGPEIMNLAQDIEKTGLPYMMGDMKIQESYKFCAETMESWMRYELVPVFVARHPADIYRMHMAWPGGGEKDRILGELFGYPKTAIDAYMGKIPRSCSKTGIGISTRDPESFFTQFVFSEEFFSEEYKTAQRWHDTIRKLSPLLYEEVKREYCLGDVVIGKEVPLELIKIIINPDSKCMR